MSEHVIHQGRANKEWFALAAGAFHAAHRGDWPAAKACVEKIGDDYGGSGLRQAMLSWMDTLIAARGSTFELSTAVYRDIDDGTDRGFGQLPPATQWAALMIAARADDDEPAFNALIASAPEGQFGVYIGELLRICTLNMPTDWSSQ